jgi:2-methylcitrate dehydratase PrpD
MDRNRALAEFVASLQFRHIPDTVVAKTEELFLDWLASALAGKGARTTAMMERFAETMGPGDGPSEILTARWRTSPFFAALVNAAASHVVEQDDVHSSSVLHPGTVVFPAVLAAAQDTDAWGRDLITAAVAGYECGVRVGEFLGRSHYKIFHTTGTAGTLAAAAGAGRVLGLDPRKMTHCFGSAGTMAAGLWEFLRDAADSKQLHTAHAAAGGLMAAYLARDGFTGASRILDGSQGLAAGMSEDANGGALVDGLGTRWATAETSFKLHASCRHTHPAADALLLLMQRQALEARDIAKVTALVHQSAIDVLGPVTDPRTVHQSKFSMGFVLAVIAVHGRAGLDEFSEAALDDPRLRQFHDKVTMVLDAEVDEAFPTRWIGKVFVETTDGRTFAGRVDTPKGDPGNSLSRPELEEKAMRLAAYGDAATPAEMHSLIQRIWRLRDEADVRGLLE